MYYCSIILIIHIINGIKQILSKLQKNVFQDFKQILNANKAI